MNQINEGGNIFKNPTGQPATQRINQADVDPTIAWLEKITGLPLQSNKLGTTGTSPTSGDIDVAVDQSKITKDQLVSKLTQWAKLISKTRQNGLRKVVLAFILKHLLTVMLKMDSYKLT